LARLKQLSAINWVPAQMRIATYNVNGINGRLSVLLRWLKTHQPDVACLQELRAPQEKFPLKEIEALGYHALWHGQKSWNGVAILGRGERPIELRRGLPGDPEDLHSRYLEAELFGITIGCLYLPNGNPAPGPKFDYKLAWFRRLNAHAAALLRTGRPTVLCGDYNAVPTPLDAYKPERWVGDAVFFPETRELYRQLVAQGWTDALRHLHPGEAIYTYWDYFRNAFGRNAGLRMDHLLLSPVLAKQLAAAGVDREVRSWEKTSDHAPAWIELKGSLTKAPKGKRRVSSSKEKSSRATNAPAGHSHRTSQVRKRTQLKTKMEGKSAGPSAARGQASSSPKRKTKVQGLQREKTR